jgi:cysteinyl-tRNA synthetase
MATEHIPGIIEMVAGLIEKGFAYEVEGDVYFEVRKFPGYGKLSKRKLDDQLPGARVAIDERLRDPRDFALWKSAKPGEPSWESPWGPGRPGWHIECSVMSLKHLGMDFDIHGGGSDLIFPHHEDEIAQSEAYTGESPLCRYWLHTGWLTLHKEKMSKSLGNFFTVEEVGAKFPLAVIRYFLVATHYRTQLEFSDASLTEAQSAFERIAILAKRVRDLLAAPAEAGESAPSPLREYSPATRQAFREAMDDDFNTPRALGALFTFVTQVNEIINTPGFVLTAGAQAELRDVQDCLTEVGDVLGLPLGPEAAPITAGPSAEAKAQLLADLRGLTAGKEQAAAALGEDLADDLDRLVRAAISLRRQARADKDWKIADGIRDLLASAGIVLEDFPEGTSWRLR